MSCYVYICDCVKAAFKYTKQNTFKRTIPDLFWQRKLKQAFQKPQDRTQISFKLCCDVSKYNFAVFFRFQKLDYKSLLACHFDSMDALHDKNGYVDSDEWLQYFLEYRNNKSVSMPSSGSMSAGSLKQLQKSHFQYKKHNHHGSASKYYVHNKYINRTPRINNKQDRMR